VSESTSERIKLSGRVEPALSATSAFASAVLFLLFFLLLDVGSTPELAVHQRHTTKSREERAEKKKKSNRSKKKEIAGGALPFGNGTDWPPLV